MSIINRRGIFGLFGGGIAASISDASNGPVSEGAYGATSSGLQYFTTPVSPEAEGARQVLSALEHTQVPSRSSQKYKDQTSWLGDVEASINSMKSLSPSARARMILDVHLERRARVALERRVNIVRDYAKPLVAIGILTQAEVDTLIETGEGADKLRMLAGMNS